MSKIGSIADPSLSESSYIYPVCLPKISENVGHLAGYSVIVAGYGPDPATKANKTILTQGHLTAYTQDFCKKEYNQAGNVPSTFKRLSLPDDIQPSIICASNPVRT